MIAKLRVLGGWKFADGRKNQGIVVVQVSDRSRKVSALSLHYRKRLRELTIGWTFAKGCRRSCGSLVLVLVIWSWWIMWRFMAVPLFLTLIPLGKADVSVIERFSHDPVPLLEAGDDSISIRFSWQANVRHCQLVLDQQSIDVSSVTSATVNIPESMDVRLRCGTVEAITHIPVRKKVSIVSLTLIPAPEGKLIRWDAFGALRCQIRDRANQLDVTDLPAKGQYSVNQPLSALAIQLSCEDAQGFVASTRLTEFHRGLHEVNLWAKAADLNKK